jgi:hypothetical protein
VTIPSDSLAAAGSQWVVYLKFEGWGPHSSGNYFKFATAPLYDGSPDSAGWLTCLTDYPSIDGENIPDGGGFAQSASMSFTAADTEGVILQSYRCASSPVGVLKSSPKMYDGSTSMTIESTNTIAVGSYLFIDSECVYVSATSTSGATTTLTISRGECNTTDSDHIVGSIIYDSNPFVVGRKVTAYLYRRGDTYNSQMYDMGTFVIDSISWENSCKLWHFSCSSLMSRFYTRIGDKNYLRMKGLPSGDRASKLIISNTAGVPLEYPPFTTAWKVAGGNDQISEVTYDSSENSLTILSTGVGGSKMDSEPLKELTALSVVMSSDLRCVGGSDFRWSPGSYFGGTTATGTSSGTWKQSANMVDIMLCLLTSRYDDYDTSTNYSSTYGNWQSLPAGFGLGIPQADIDMDSFMRVRHRTRNIEFEGFSCGLSPEPFAELATKHFLKVLNAYMVLEDSKLRLVMQRSMTRNMSPLFALTDSNIMVDIPSLGSPIAKDIPSTLSGTERVDSVTYTTSTRDGGKSEFTFTRPPGTTRSLLASSSETIDCSSVLASSGTTMLDTIAARRLANGKEPVVEFVVKATMSEAYILPGQLGTITSSNLINAKTGSVGVTSAVVECRSKKVNISTDGASVDLKLRMYISSGSSGIVSPSAYITSVSGNVATVSANVFTPGQDLDGTVLYDTSLFGVGDECQLFDSAGLEVTSVTQTVVSKTSTSITFDGDFSATMASGYTICHCQRQGQVSAQYSNYVSIFEQETLTFGGDYGNELWSWGDL